MTPHKWADVIKAYADGARVQVRLAGGIWLDTANPQWSSGKQYRVHPGDAAALSGAAMNAHREDVASHTFAQFGPRIRELWEEVRRARERLPDGTRVWVYPGTTHGYESRVKGYYKGVYVVATHPGAETTYNRYVDEKDVVKFDENHNQKRAFVRGKAIQQRSKSTSGIEGSWRDCANPQWRDDCEYRIKPKSEPAVAVVKQLAHCGPIGGIVEMALEFTALEGKITNITVKEWHELK